jgi:hypothetical protein
MALVLAVRLGQGIRRNSGLWPNEHVTPRVASLHHVVSQPTADYSIFPVVRGERDGGCLELPKSRDCTDYNFVALLVFVVTVRSVTP